MDTKTMSIVGLVLGFLVPIAGIIVSAIALNKMKQSGIEEGKGMAMAGLIIGIILTVIGVIGTVCYVCVIGLAVAGSGY